MSDIERENRRFYNERDNLQNKRQMEKDNASLVKQRTRIEKQYRIDATY